MTAQVALLLLAAGLAGLTVWSHARGERRRARGAAIGLVLVAGLWALVLGQDLGSQKLAAALFLPANLMWLWLGAGAVHLAAKGFGRFALFPGIPFLFYGIGANPTVATMALEAYESAIPPRGPIADLPEFDAVFVLGGGVIERADDHEIQLTEWSTRLLEAVHLYEAKKARYLVASGGEGTNQTGPTVAVWRSMGVPAEAILTIERGRTTSEELLAYQALIAERRFERVALISSAFHLPRAMGGARRLGLDFTPIATDRQWLKAYTTDANVLIPHPESWLKTELLAREIYGTLVGR